MHEPILRAARAFAGDPFFQTLFVADPRYSMPGPCEPPAVKWWLNECGGDALLLALVLGTALWPMVGITSGRPVRAGGLLKSPASIRCLWKFVAVCAALCRD